MPHLPIERLRWDFALALSQAILFGLSILYPLAFVFSVGFILLFSLVRQSYECGKLAAQLAPVIVRRTSSLSSPVSESLPVLKREQAGTSEDYIQTIRHRIKDAFDKKRGDSDEEKRIKKEMLPLQLWAGPRALSWLGASVLLVVGSLGIGLSMMPTISGMFRWLNIYLVLHFGVTVGVVAAAHRTLKQRGPLLVYSKDSEGAEPIMMRMDKAAEVLAKRIEGLEQ